MDVIIWAIILGAVFYINKKSKSAGSKNTQSKQNRRPQQKQDTADMEQHAEYSSVGYECIEPDMSAEITATDAAESTAASETTDAAESTATAETTAEQSGYTMQRAQWQK